MDGPQLIRSLKPMLMGQDPLERERIHAGMRLINRAVSYRTIGAVDTALWDLAGKIAGLPVHALMGTFRTSILGYASSQVLPDVAAYVDQAQEFKANGWRAYKIHPPRDPDHDIKVCDRRAQGGGRRLSHNAQFHLELRLHPGAARRPRDRGAGVSTGTRTRSPTRTSTTTSSCAKNSTSRSWRRNSPPAGSIPIRYG